MVVPCVALGVYPCDTREMSKSQRSTSRDQVVFALLPLRLFLGFIYIYAGFDKFFSSEYWSLTSPIGFLADTTNAQVGSPIGFMLGIAISHPTLIAFVIAAAEIFAGAGIFFGIWTRVSAVGAFSLSATFFLSVSWATQPFYYGADLIFMAALIPFIMVGDAGHFSVERFINEKVRKEFGVKPESNLSNKPLEEQIRRRTLIRTGALAGIVGAGSLAVGLVGKSRSTSAGSAATPTDSAVPTESATTPSAPTGKKIASSVDIPVGGSFAFKDSSGNDAFLLQPAAGTYLAYSAVCTHQGCTVEATASAFSCACHGAKFDLATGDVLKGPARQPLAKLNVTVSGTDIYLA
ncbi:MAG: Rieske 2Fe-2S domain-containing protein [Actinobacteria bacterium]|uniref:Unannotated protein n=1 Tax=freshwater metagenome TaxID=449393 RepID=A0A6J5YNB6_9ZZZZ|nr:Rieske 2Fe-2S domain-containing protein [Actinomycetota bacterium]